MPILDEMVPYYIRLLAAYRASNRSAATTILPWRRDLCDKKHASAGDLSVELSKLIYSDPGSVVAPTSPPPVERADTTSPAIETLGRSSEDAGSENISGARNARCPLLFAATAKSSSESGINGIERYRQRNNVVDEHHSQQGHASDRGIVPPSEDQFSTKLLVCVEQIFIDEDFSWQLERLGQLRMLVTAERENSAKMCRSHFFLGPGSYDSLLRIIACNIEALAQTEDRRQQLVLSRDEPGFIDQSNVYSLKLLTSIRKFILLSSLDEEIATSERLVAAEYNLHTGFSVTNRILIANVRTKLLEVANNIFVGKSASDQGFVKNMNDYQAVLLQLKLLPGIAAEFTDELRQGILDLEADFVAKFPRGSKLKDLVAEYRVIMDRQIFRDTMFKQADGEGSPYTPMLDARSTVQPPTPPRFPTPMLGRL